MYCAATANGRVMPFTTGYASPEDFLKYVLEVYNFDDIFDHCGVAVDTCARLLDDMYGIYHKGGEGKQQAASILQQMLEYAAALEACATKAPSTKSAPLLPSLGSNTTCATVSTTETTSSPPAAAESLPPVAHASKKMTRAVSLPSVFAEPTLPPLFRDGRTDSGNWQREPRAHHRLDAVGTAPLRKTRRLKSFSGAVRSCNVTRRTTRCDNQPVGSPVHVAERPSISRSSEPRSSCDTTASWAGYSRLIESCSEHDDDDGDGDDHPDATSSSSSSDTSLVGELGLMCAGPGITRLEVQTLLRFHKQHPSKFWPLATLRARLRAVYFGAQYWAYATTSMQSEVFVFTESVFLFAMDLRSLYLSSRDTSGAATNPHNPNLGQPPSPPPTPAPPTQSLDGSSTELPSQTPPEAGARQQEDDVLLRRNEPHLEPGVRKPLLEPLGLAVAAEAAGATLDPLDALREPPSKPASVEVPGTPRNPGGSRLRSLRSLLARGSSPEELPPDVSLRP
jgi:hypothetical protein